MINSNHSCQQILLDVLSKHDTWEKKLDAFIECVPNEILHMAPAENYKIYFTSIYKHLVALREYDVTSLPPLKSPVLLLKSTFRSIFSTEDYDLSKVILIQLCIYKERVIFSETA